MRFATIKLLIASLLQFLEAQDAYNDTKTMQIDWAKCIEEYCEKQSMNEGLSLSYS